MKYILEAYTWEWYWKHKDLMLVVGLSTFAALLILLGAYALWTLKKDINELEKQTEL